MGMNIFRLTGDMLHLLSIFIILWKMLSTRGCSGLSFKTQFLYALVFTTRYLDLYLTLYSVYLTTMKIFFLLSSYYILFLIRVRFRASYDAQGDSFSMWWLIVPAFLVTVIVQASLSPHPQDLMELCWVFSEFLESVAILPQLFMLQKTGACETLTVHYLAALGGYRAFYIANWVYRYWAEGKRNWISWIAGSLQTLLYSDFFYHYFRVIILKKRETII